MPWRPTYPGEIPTLGWYALDWIADNLRAPDRGEYEPFMPTREQAEFVLRLHEVDPRTCRRIVRRAVLSRPRGWGKSPFVSALAICEALADIVPDGWDANGQPVGRPWHSIRTPYVRIAANSESQANNAWRPLLEMLADGAPVLDNYPGLEPMGTFVNLPRRGKIEPITSSGMSEKGNPSVFGLMDQTEEWFTGNGGIRLADVMRNNAAKIGGIVIETPNAFTPGLNSVAEKSAIAYADMREGRTRLERGLLWDHREAPGDTDMTDAESLAHGLRIAYGDSCDHPDGCLIHDPPCAPGWSPLDALMARIWEPDADEQVSRADFLNQITHASDAWISQPDWAGRRVITDPIRIGDVVTLGFDGSRGRAKGKPDATALIGCRVRDGRIFQLGVWEADDHPETWADWTPSIVDIEATIADAFAQYQVVGMYADPGRDWRSFVDAWEATYSRHLQVKATVSHPMEWWMTGGRAAAVEAAIEQCEGAVLAGDLTHDGSSALTRHVINSRRRLSHGRLALAKESPSSARKIDAAVAMVLAWQARLKAVSLGLPVEDFIPYRIR